MCVECALAVAGIDVGPPIAQLAKVLLGYSLLGDAHALSVLATEAGRTTITNIESNAKRKPQR